MKIDIDDAASWSLFCVIAAIVGFGLYVGFKSATATGRQDWCFVQAIAPDGMAPQYTLWGHVEWRNDHRIGIYSTPELAAAAASTLHCPLGSQP